MDFPNRKPNQTVPNYEAKVIFYTRTSQRNRG